MYNKKIPKVKLRFCDPMRCLDPNQNQVKKGHENQSRNSDNSLICQSQKMSQLVFKIWTFAECIAVQIRRPKLRSFSLNFILLSNSSVWLLSRIVIVNEQLKMKGNHLCYHHLVFCEQTPYTNEIFKTVLI